MAKEKRRGRGEGSITHRADGRWHARVDLGFNAEGKRIRKNVYGRTRQEAHNKLQDLIAEQRGGLIMQPNKMTVAEWFEQWRNNPGKEWAKRTREGYKSAIRCHITPHIGTVKLQDLKPYHIDALFKKLTHIPGTCDVVRKALSGGLDRAVKFGLIAFNPIRKVDCPVYNSPAVDTWTADQAETFLMAARESRFYGLFLLAITTGAREGELLSLKWENVHDDHFQIRTTTELGGGVKSPKTKSSVRRVPLSDFAREALADRRAESVREGNAASPWVFCAVRGKMQDPAHFRVHHFHPILNESGLPRIRFHDLRHCCATYLLEQGTHPAIVAALLGHSKVATTLDTYSHVTDTLAATTAATMQAKFGRQLGVKTG